MMTMMTVDKPLPLADYDSAPFWEGCRANRLLVQRCQSCGTHRFPPAHLCPRCRSREAAWVESTGSGRVYSWIVVRHPVPSEIYGSDVPYIVALVELEEGVRMASNIVECTPEAMKADMPVEVTFTRIDDRVTLPQFRPVTAAAR